MDAAPGYGGGSAPGIGGSAGFGYGIIGFGYGGGGESGNGGSADGSAGTGFSFMRRRKFSTFGEMSENAMRKVPFRRLFKIILFPRRRKTLAGAQREEFPFSS